MALNVFRIRVEVELFYYKPVVYVWNLSDFPCVKCNLFTDPRKNCAKCKHGVGVRFGVITNGMTCFRRMVDMKH